MDNPNHNGGNGGGGGGEESREEEEETHHQQRQQQQHKEKNRNETRKDGLRQRMLVTDGSGRIDRWQCGLSGVRERLAELYTTSHLSDLTLLLADNTKIKVRE